MGDSGRHTKSYRNHHSLPHFPDNQDPVDPRRELGALVAISTGGAIGTIARYGFELAIPSSSGGFDTAIFIANLAGAFVLGLFATVVVTHLKALERFTPFFAVGVLGGFTTFSTMEVDTVQLIRAGHAELAILYLAATVIGGAAACLIGQLIPGLVKSRSGNPPTGSEILTTGAKDYSLNLGNRTPGKGNPPSRPAKRHGSGTSGLER